MDEVFSLMHKLNVKITNRKLREAFKVCSFTSNSIKVKGLSNRNTLLSTSALVICIQERTVTSHKP